MIFNNSLFHIHIDYDSGDNHNDNPNHDDLVFISQAECLVFTFYDYKLV